MTPWRVAAASCVVFWVACAVPADAARSTVPVAGATWTAVEATDALPVGASAFLPVEPCRLADSRQPEPGATRLGGDTWRVAVAGRCGVPLHASAVAVTLTATGTAGPGFLTAFPGGSRRAETSNLNWSAAGATRANAAITMLGDGALDVFVSSATDVVVDVTGAFVPVDGDAPAAGRFVAHRARLLDTRSGPAVRADEVVTVPLASPIPADAVAVAVNITMVDADGWGYASVAPAGGPPTATSVVNVEHPGQTRAASTIVAAGREGITIRTSAAAHVLVDVTGWFTGPSMGASPSGLYVPLAPRRLVDTRDSRPVRRDVAVYLDCCTAGIASSPTSAIAAGAAVVNWTVTDAVGAGFAWTAGFADTDPSPPVTSALNVAAGEGAVANLELAPLSTSSLTRGPGLSVRVSTAMHVIGDLNGWYTAPSAPPGPTTNRPCRRVYVVGDSLLNAAKPTVLAGLDSLAASAGVVSVVDARGGRTIPEYPDARLSGVLTARRLRAEHGDADCWVVELGANGMFWISNPGPYGRSAEETAENYISMMLAAVSPNARVMWVNVATQPMTPSAQTFNAALAAEAARSELFDVRDWAAVATPHPEWFVDDVHVDHRGAQALADLMLHDLVPPPI